MDNGRFYSTAHVFSLFNDTFYTDFFIRDGDGKTYKITDITGFASDRDFITFDVEGFVSSPGAGLHAGKDSELDTPIFSVGNALGDGIVIRDGTLTSRTFENENGEWKWLRFSAAASPGNSGGPLVNSAGEVLGIITMKSENENLNYALPFSETESVPPGKGVFRMQYAYTLPNIQNKQFHSRIDYTFDLPCSIDTAQKTLTKEFKEQSQKLVDGARKEFAPDGGKSFATATGYLDIMYDSFSPSFPYTIVLADNSKWGIYYPKNITEYVLPSNGKIYSGSMINANMTYIKKPDDVPLEKLITSPRMYMDYILKASRMYRTVGSEQVTITSYGEPAAEETYTDGFGRLWNIAYWDIPFANAGVIACALPMPDGIYVMSRTAPISDIYNGFNHDLKFLADYVIPRCTGTAKNWEEFLSLKPDVYPLPPLFKNMKFKSTASETYIKAGIFEADFPADVLSPGDSGLIDLYIGYTFDGKDAAETVRGFGMSTKQRSSDSRYCLVFQPVKPPEEAPDQMHEHWEQIRDGVTPFDGVPYNQEQYTLYAEALFPRGHNPESDDLFALQLQMRGTGKDSEITKFASDVKKAFRSPPF